MNGEDQKNEPETSESKSSNHTDAPETLDNNSSDHTDAPPEQAAEAAGVTAPTSRFSPAKVTGFSLVTVLLVVSIILNLFLLFYTGADAPTSMGPFPSILAMGLILVTTISLVIAFWAHHARSIYLKDGPALVPEKWGMILEGLTEFFKLQHSQSQASLAAAQKATEIQAEKSNEVLESFLTLQEALTARDNEIARLKKGHDAKIFKRFLNRFIRVDRALGEMEAEFSDPAQQKNYRYLKRVMQDALEECGVEEYWPDTGADYRDAGPEIAEEPAVIDTDDPEQDFRIAAVLSKGYVVTGEGDGEVIVPAKVSIFRLRQQENEVN